MGVIMQGFCESGTHCLFSCVICILAPFFAQLYVMCASYNSIVNEWTHNINTVWWVSCWCAADFHHFLLTLSFTLHFISLSSPPNHTLPMSPTNCEKKCQQYVLAWKYELPNKGRRCKFDMRRIKMGSWLSDFTLSISFCLCTYIIGSLWFLLVTC